MTLPSWTITRYEVERDEKIGMGFFSDVYRGTWRSRVVAIKVLAPTTPRELFKNEVLKHGGGRDPWKMVSTLLTAPEMESGDAEAMAAVGKWKIEDEVSVPGRH